MNSPGDLSMDAYHYELPAERIAVRPLENRDQSRLLIYRNEQIEDTNFYNIPDHLNEGDLLIANETKVVQARLIFHSVTGARIELFCLEPSEAGAEIQTAMQLTGTVEWMCMAGNLKKWKSDEILVMKGSTEDVHELTAQLLDRQDGTVKVRFSWEPRDLSFAGLLEYFGKVPLPPYLRREAEDEDKLRYQTVFAHVEGSVAAPTAGLHFTERVLDALAKKGVKQGLVTLHVGAGTFKPVSSEKLKDHEMHREQIVVNRLLMEQLVACKERIAAVGTTSLRTLESLYWTAVKGMKENVCPPAIEVEQWYPYQFSENELPGREEAFRFLLECMNKHRMDELKGDTRLIIAPGYTIRSSDLLITNFHQPGSTLILLVSACIGDHWKKVYQYALDNGFRFLSYGDSSMLEIKK